MENNRSQAQGKRTKRNPCHASRIDVLPDDVLLEIFDFYMEEYPLYSSKTTIEEWQTLIHVCRRWRNIVFGSPRRLDLRLYCTPETPVRDTLDVWPALPLIVKRWNTSSGTDDVIAALRQTNRVCEVDLWALEEVLVAMQVPFPELTAVYLESNGETPPVIPDSFLDGSAPRLQFLSLDGIPFPGLPKLLLSASHLVSLWLLIRGTFHPKRSSLSSLRCPAFNNFPLNSNPLNLALLMKPDFRGVTEYLEDLVTRIDTPQLEDLQIGFFNQIDFDIPRVVEFINRIPKLTKRDAYVAFNKNFACVGLSLQHQKFQISILCRESDWQLSSIEQICNSSLHSFSTVEDLYIRQQDWPPVWKGDAIENTLWLRFLLPFTAVKNLYLSKVFAPGIAAALEELVGDRITEVLPNLQNIFMKELEPSGPFQENIGQFVAARQLLDHPITVSESDKYW